LVWSLRAIVSDINNAERLPDLERISVIAPVKNEEASIRRLLEGLFAQTHQPAEIVITDGGSTDRTREIIRERGLSSLIPIVLVETDEALPGKGRNLAIARAGNEWIASIDAGIKPRPDWLAQLVSAARKEPDAEVVYGVAEPLRDSYFTECAAITYVPGGRFTRTIPSCLLRRSAWVKAGAFREDLRSGEDLLFFRSLDAAGVKTTESQEAVAIWELCPTLAGTFRRFVIYSRNGMRAGLARNWQYNVTRMYLGILVLSLAGLWFWPLLLFLPTMLLLRAEKRILGWYRVQAPQRLLRELLNPRRVLTVACINTAIDIATFCGMWQWLVHDRTARVKDEGAKNNA
jgi:glycosyltransferase involved in cell wall biosynthesis